MALFLRGLCLLAGYLFGGFLTAEVVARCTAGVSARDIGTGNPGMANIATHLGKKAGLLVLAGDVIKTAVACWFCHQLAPELGLTALLYGGLGAVLGHNWPIWYKGRGGNSCGSGNNGVSGGSGKCCAGQTVCLCDHRQGEWDTCFYWCGRCSVKS